MDAALNHAFDSPHGELNVFSLAYIYMMTLALLSGDMMQGANDDLAALVKECATFYKVNAGVSVFQVQIAAVCVATVFANGFKVDTAHLIDIGDRAFSLLQIGLGPIYSSLMTELCSVLASTKVYASVLKVFSWSNIRKVSNSRIGFDSVHIAHMQDSCTHARCRTCKLSRM